MPFLSIAIAGKRWQIRRNRNSGNPCGGLDLSDCDSAHCCPPCCCQHVCTSPSAAYSQTTRQPQLLCPSTQTISCSSRASAGSAAQHCRHSSGGLQGSSCLSLYECTLTFATQVNAGKIQALVDHLRTLFRTKIQPGGDKKARDRHLAKGKMLPRQRFAVSLLSTLDSRLKAFVIDCRDCWIMDHRSSSCLSMLGMSSTTRPCQLAV